MDNRSVATNTQAGVLGSLNASESEQRVHVLGCPANGAAANDPLTTPTKCRGDYRHRAHRDATDPTKIDHRHR
jgi:hypothetical protein